MKTENTIFDLKSLQRVPNNPIRFYDGSDLYKINFCGAAACATPGGTPTPGCKQSVSGQLGQDETSIGAYYGAAKADIDMNDIVDINFKTKQQPEFQTDTKGIKIYYSAPGQQGAAPGQSGQPQQQVGGFGAPTQPPAAGGWPNGRRLLQQWPSAQQPQQQPGMPQQPGMQQPGMQQPGAPGMAQVSADSSPLTVF